MHTCGGEIRLPLLFSLFFSPYFLLSYACASACVRGEEEEIPSLFPLPSLHHHHPLSLFSFLLSSPYASLILPLAWLFYLLLPLFSLQLFISLFSYLSSCLPLFLSHAKKTYVACITIAPSALVLCYSCISSLPLCFSHQRKEEEGEKREERVETREEKENCFF